jgi:hypothetical protein
VAAAVEPETVQVLVVLPAVLVHLLVLLVVQRLVVVAVLAGAVVQVERVVT